ncbi:hypothetical protein GGR53DRAFT_513737 [Hypoxylon sp. FL1150]|nr:hypothetical protein GGR53DRAFT_513737 [Hypoxylon sp. FL1150]
MESPPASDTPFDSSKPFQGLVLCCTNIEADLRTAIAQRTVDLGGAHKYDLTPDVTHLIIGDYDTAKYRHVARERPDIKPMAAGWVNAVRALWVVDQEFDFAALEETWKLKTFETDGGNPNGATEEHRARSKLTCCLTGFEDNDTRTMIESKVKANGGDYVGDLSKRVTHLIVNKPEGKKYVAARKWGIKTVSIEWLHDSVERGMILNEECYDPTLPQEERGNGAWIRRELQRASLGKRSRDNAAAPLADDGRRKLRKTASMKFTSQGESLWGDIVKQSAVNLSKPSIEERPASVPPHASATEPATPAVASPQLPQLNSHTEEVKGGIFSRCRFYVHGFPRNRREIVQHHITSHDGRISESLDDAASSSHSEPSDRRYLVVPQTSQPDSHPTLPEGVHVVTEFYIERCVHNIILAKLNDHVLGRPFPRFPIEGFGDLSICTAGFRNERLNQVEKTIIQLGAAYSERLNSQCTLLLCPSLDSIRKQKLDFAIQLKIPVVNADWLWQCITTGCLVPWDRFLFKEVPQESQAPAQYEAPKSKDKEKKASLGPAPKPRKEPESKAPVPATKHGIDMTAFDDNMQLPQDDAIQREQSPESNYETAPAHHAEEMDVDHPTESAPLSEKTSNALNKSPSPAKTAPPQRKLKRFPTGGEIGDSESGGELDDPQSLPENLPENLPEEDDGLKKAEEERKQKAERAKAQREEMSKHLNSLVTPEVTSQDGTGLKPQPAPRQQRRRREILGRATSNVSTASSASAESLTHMSSSKSNLRRTESIASRMDGAGGFGFMDKMAAQHGDSNQEEDTPPPATQLEYDNSEAKRHRAAVLERMAASSKHDDKASASSGQSQKAPVELERKAKASSVQSAPTRRMTRRR